MADLASLRVMVYGRVQRVYFRDFTSKCAGELGLTGWVRNLPNGKTLEVQAEGERSKLERLVEHLKDGPPRARVERLEINWSGYTGSYPDFIIRD